MRDGLLVEPSSPLPNFAFNGLALTVLTTLGLGREARVQRLATTLENLAGERLSPSDVNTQDNSLRGWSWVPGTFSWVEPTAYVLLGLKVHASCTKRPLDRARIQEAEAVLFDRACRRGGWNYGNSNMLGAELRPYVPTTALALLALFDRRSHGAVAAGLRFLQEEALSERSGHALSLARIALLRYDAPTATLREALSRRGMSLDGLESIATVAMTSCALAEDAHAPFTF